MKILIVCNPDEGSATELSLYLKCEAERMNRRVIVLNATEIARTPEKFDATIIVGEIQNKRFSEPVQQYVFANLQHLNGNPSFFLTLQGCTDENNLKVPDATKGFVREFLADRTKFERGLKTAKVSSMGKSRSMASLFSFVMVARRDSGIASGRRM